MRRWRGFGWEVSFLATFLAAVAAKVAVDAGAPSLLLDAMRLACLACALGALRDPSTRWLDRWRLLLVVVALWALPSVYARVGGDGLQCYVLLRSPLLDHDLDFANDYAGLAARPVLLATGEVTTAFPIGLSVLWAPAFLLAHAVSGVARLAGAAVAADGFGPVYQSAVTTASFLYAWGALLLLERALRRSHPPGLSTGVVLALFLATPLHFYMVANPSMTHAGSVFAVTMLVLSWLHARRTGTLAAWALTGIAGGLAAWVRPQDSVLMIVPLADLVLTAGPRARRLLALVAPAVLMGAVQVAVWIALYGFGFVGVIQDQSYVGRTELQIVDLLFSARHGLFSWTPLYLAAALGWLLWMRSAPRLAALFVLGFAASVLANAAMQDWWGSEAFGQRRMLGLTALFALGAGRDGGRAAPSSRGRRDRDGGGPRRLEHPARVHLQQRGHRHAHPGHEPRPAGRGPGRRGLRPPAALGGPAARAAVWALLYEYTRGIWVDEGPRSLGGVVDVGSEPSDLPQVVGPGWHDPESQDGVTWRRMRGRRAWIRVPIRSPVDYEMVVRARRAAPDAPALLRLDLNDHDVGEVALSADWSEHAFAVPAAALRPA